MFSELAERARWTARAARAPGLHPRSARGLLRRARRPRDARAQRTAATRTRRRPTSSSTAPSPPTSGGMLEMANARLYAFWGSLTEGLRTGAPQNEAKQGGDFFEALYADPARLAQFAARDERHQHRRRPGDRGEVPLGATTAPSIDVGCAEGAVPGPDRARARAHHRRRLRPAAARADLRRLRRRASGSSDRLSFTGGDFFADPLPQADVLVMGHILHDWDLEEKRALLRRPTTRCPTAGR